MAPDLGFVAHSPEGHANELAVGRLGNRLTERGLADARRADQAENGRLDLIDALLNSKVLDDPFLHALQAVVVLVEDLLGRAQIFRHARTLLPWQSDQGLDVVANYGGLSRHRRHQLELLDFRVGLGQRLLAHAGSLDLLLHLFEIGTLFAFTELLLDGFDLLVQVVLALALFHLPLDATTDALFHLQDVQFGLKLRQQLLQPHDDVEDLENFLLELKLQRQVGCDRVGQSPRLFDSTERSQDLRRDLLVEFHVLIELSQDSPAHGFYLVAGTIVDDHRRHIGDEQRSLILDAIDRGPLRAFDEYLDSTVRQLEHLQDVGNAANRI